MLATGSGTKALPGMDFDGKLVLSSDHILSLDRILKRLAVLGGGAVGVEFASVFRSYGSEVTVIELLPTSSAARRRGPRQACSTGRSQRRKIGVMVASKLEKLEKLANGVKLVVAAADGKTQIDIEDRPAPVRRRATADHRGRRARQGQDQARPPRASSPSTA